MSAGPAVLCVAVDFGKGRDSGDRMSELGAIAQLGERRHGMAEVVGSIPTSSTELLGAQTTGAPTR